MEKFRIIVSGYQDGYLTSELIEVEAIDLYTAAIIAERKSSLDGASAKI